ncbi:MAG: aspartate aminotransferase family protein [Candidatus Dormibacteria bacterium]
MRIQGVSGPETRRWLDRDRQVITHAYHRYNDLVVDRGEGSRLFDVEGRAFIDFACGIAVTSLGHGHPAVLDAARRQMEKLVHVSVVAQHELNVRLAERLVELAPAGLEMAFLANSGAEAVEGAIKLARRVLGRSEIVAFTGGFHGRTYGAMTLTSSKAHYSDGYGPLLPGVHHVPYPRPLDMGGDDAALGVTRAGIEDLFSRVSPGTVAAFVVEPVLGEGGYVVPPPGFMPMLRQLADEHGILLVADEVQSGVARTGKWWAVDHSSTAPDVMLVAKALGNGFPISAILGRRDLMEAWPPAAHGSTFGGNPVACAAALATLEVIEEQGLARRAGDLGAEILERLTEATGSDAGVRQVRGLGLMLGIEFQADGRHDSGRERQEAVRAASLAHGLVILSCGRDDEVIRLIPPLNISGGDLDEGLGALESAISHTAA